MDAVLKTGLILCTLAWLGGCAAPRPAPPLQPAAPIIHPNYTADITSLRQALAAEVPNAIAPGVYDALWVSDTQAQFDASPYRITSPQLVVAVDRSPSVQQLRILFATPWGPWQVIGGGKVSTGRTGRHGYFITPTGVFPHTIAILDYRALGTYNQNHIRGLGVKGSRVW